MSSITLQDIAERVHGEIVGQADTAIHGLADVDNAAPGQLTFIGSQRFVERWRRSRASAALVADDLTIARGEDSRPLIRVANVDLAMAKVLEMFAPAWPEPAQGVHPAAVVDPQASLGKNVRIGPGCVVGANATIGDDTILQANVTVMAESRIGRQCVLWPGVVIRERCVVGDHCIFHPNVNIGADGFGYRPASDGRGLVKVPQIGTVEIGDDVEIGAGACIDRGKFAATRIGDGTKIDNLVQIGHNCQLGKCVIIAGAAGIAGSVTIGDGTVIGGMAGFKDHITVGRNVRIAGGAQVMQDVPDDQAWSGTPAMPVREAVRLARALKRLPDLVKQLRTR